MARRRQIPAQPAGQLNASDDGSVVLETAAESRRAWAKDGDGAPAHRLGRRQRCVTCGTLFPCKKWLAFYTSALDGYENVLGSTRAGRRDERRRAHDAGLDALARRFSTGTNLFQRSALCRADRSAEPRFGWHADGFGGWSESQAQGHTPTGMRLPVCVP